MNTLMPADNAPNPVRSLAPAMLIVLLFGILVWAPITHPASRAGEAAAEGHFPVAQMGDQIKWHETVVRRFAAQFPVFDFSDYPSAIAPGYYVIMAAFAQLNDSRLSLQIASSFFGLLLLLALWRLVQAFSPLSSTDLLVLPLLTSPYVIATSIWMNTASSGIGLGPS